MNFVSLYEPSINLRMSHTLMVELRLLRRKVSVLQYSTFIDRTKGMAKSFHKTDHSYQILELISEACTKIVLKTEGEMLEPIRGELKVTKLKIQREG